MYINYNHRLKKVEFEWDDDKDDSNQEKHGVAFDEAQKAFFDPHRILAEDLDHSHEENRYYCFGKVDNRIMTVRFTMRNNKVRIIGAGHWRKGRRIYEEAQKSKIH